MEERVNALPKKCQPLHPVPWSFGGNSGVGMGELERNL